MILVIAEKPQAADYIAKNKGATKGSSGYYEGNGYVITNAYGHLFELYEPDQYDEKYSIWDAEDLPIIPDFKYKLKDEGYIKRQFSLLKELILRKPQMIINACDADREGESIFWSILKACGGYDLTKVKRLWFDDLNDEGLNAAFKNLKDITDYEGLYKSAEARQKADWLFGMNLTRLITTSAKSGKWIYGRVQTPTLMLVCDAFEKHHAFQPTPYWKVKAHLEHSSVGFVALNEKNYQDEVSAQSYFKSVGTNLTCSKSETSDFKEAPPKLFSLMTLQQECSRKFGMKPHTVLELVQALYEKHRLVTYPRTNSSYLPSTMKSITCDAINVIGKNEAIASEIRKSIANLVELENAAVFNDKKVSSHHAIIPTSREYKKGVLSDEETKVYFAIVTRFVQAFMQPCKKRLTKLEFQHGDDLFKVSGAVILEAGWRQLLFAGIENKDETDSDNERDQRLPEVKEGDIVKLNKAEVVERMTKRPALLTDDSLLQMMMTAGKLVEDEDLAEAMAQQGLGTEATRAEVIKRLYSIPYIGNKGKSVIPTEDGYRLYSLLKGYKIASPELTGSFEQKLAKIEKHEHQPSDFLEEITKVLVSNMDVLKDKAGILESTAKTKEPIERKCPLCNEGEVVLGANSFSCSKADWKKEGEELKNYGCNFRLPKRLLNKTLSPAIAQELLDKGKTKRSYKFKNKENKTFEAFLELQNKTELKFSFVGEGDQEVQCPKCRAGKLVFYEKAVSCDKKVDCGFFVVRTIAGKKLSTPDLIKLMKEKKTGKIKGFKSKSEKLFDAQLVLNEACEVKFVFD